jgi:branched-chain amino acid transport system substrate-binding protein
MRHRENAVRDVCCITPYLSNGGNPMIVQKQPRQVSHPLRLQAAVIVLLGVCCVLPACRGDNLACDDPLGCIEIERNEPVVLAALLPLSGDAAYLGEEALGSIEIAMADQGGGILDHPLTLTSADSGCQAITARASVESLIADFPDLVGIVGPICTAVAEATLPLVSQAGLVMVSPANTAVTLTNPATDAGGLWRPGYYRTAPPNTRQAQAAAEFAAQTLGARTAAVIFTDDSQTQELADTFVHTFRQSGGVVAFQGSISADVTDLTELLIGAMSSSPDVLYLPVLEPEGNLIVNAISRTTSFAETTLIGGMGLFVPSFPVGVGSSAVNDMFVVGPVVQGVGAEALQAEWQDRFGAAPGGPVYGQTYDAVNLLLAAIEAVAQEGRNGALLIGRQALRDALTQTAVFPGVTGPLTCSPYGDCAASTAVGLYQFSQAQVNGETWPPELVWTITD